MLVASQSPLQVPHQSAAGLWDSKCAGTPNDNLCRVCVGKSAEGRYKGGGSPNLLVDQKWQSRKPCLRSSCSSKQATEQASRQAKPPKSKQANKQTNRITPRSEQSLRRWRQRPGICRKHLLEGADVELIWEDLDHALQEVLLGPEPKP